jgi:hypothetical protein
VSSAGISFNRERDGISHFWGSELSYAPRKPG